MSESVARKYLTATASEHCGKRGLIVRIANPDSVVDTIPFAALQEIQETLDRVREDAALSFVIFCGNSLKVHAGADLRMFAGEIDSQTVREYLVAGARLDQTVKSLGKRTVSVIQGDCYGGSVEWPLMAEYSICTSDASIQFSEVNIGIIPGWSGILNVLLRSNKANALFLAATGCKIGPRDMLACGLVTQICESEDAIGCALDLATAEVIEPVEAELLSPPDETARLLESRTDAAKYLKLVRELPGKMDSGEVCADKSAGNYIGRYIANRLNELGRPLAPLAVKAVMDLLDKYADLKKTDVSAAANMALEEAEACYKLMDTIDRRTGVNSIVSANLLEKIPVYIGK